MWAGIKTTALKKTEQKKQVAFGISNKFNKMFVDVHNFQQLKHKEINHNLDWNFTKKVLFHCKC